MSRLLLCLALLGCRGRREDDARPASDGSAGQDDAGGGSSGGGSSGGGSGGETEADADTDTDSDADTATAAEADADTDTDTDTDTDSDADSDADADADADSDTEADLSGSYNGTFTLHVVGSVVELDYDIDDTCTGVAVVDVVSADEFQVNGEASCSFEDKLASFMGEQTGSVEGGADRRGDADGTVTVTFGSDSLSAVWTGEVDGATFIGSFGDALTYPVGDYTLVADYEGSFDLVK